MFTHFLLLTKMKKQFYRLIKKQEGKGRKKIKINIKIKNFYKKEN